MRTQRTVNRIVTALFLLSLIVPLARWSKGTTTAERTGTASSQDRQAARLSLKHFEHYFRDHFGMRAQLIQFRNWFRYCVLDVSPIRTVIAGKEGWLFSDDQDSMADFLGRRPFTESELERWCQVLMRRRDALERRGIRYLFVIAPNKQSIYPEYLPDALNRPGHTRVDQLLAYLGEHSDLKVLDLRPILLDAKTEGTLYYHRDSHWTDQGAQIGCTAIVQRLSHWFPDLRPRPQSAFTSVKVRNARPGDLVRMLDLQGILDPENEHLIARTELAHRCTMPSIPSSPHRSPNPDGCAAHATACPTAALSRAVVFADSFHLNLFPFLAEHFQYAVYVWQPTVQFPIVDQLGPDVVIQEMCERFLHGQPKCDESEAYEQE
jgi:hypothetical protein